MEKFIEDKIGDLFIPKNLGNNGIQNVSIEQDFLGKKTMAETGIKIPAAIPEVSNQPGITNTESNNNNEIVKWVIGGLIIVGVIYVGYQYYKKREEQEPKYKVL